MPPSPSTPPPPDSQTPNNNISSLTAGFFGVFLLLFLLVLFCFLRSKTKRRIEERNGTIFHAKGVVGPELMETKFSSGFGVPLFTRADIKQSIVMPSKSITRPPNSTAVALSQRDSFPALSIPRPLSKGSPRPRPLSNLNPSSRQSRASSSFSVYTQNPPSGTSRTSAVSPVPPFQPKPVHQLFEPALPDELPLTRYGEGLMVLQSFDDGWCLVARDMSRSHRASRFSIRSSEKVDIGLVPAWVFAEPLQGKTVTRPFRSASINALHPAQKSTDSRNGVISWSYFG